MKKVAVIMGSKSDAEVLKPTVSTLKKFGVEYEIRTLSAHRTPSEAAEYVDGLESRNFGAVICAAGKAAHLAGVAAAHTVLPVVGLPIKSSFLDGMDSLLSTVQMPSGVPVATVAVNGGENAALLCVQILALSDEGLREKLREYKKDMAKKILADDGEIGKFFD